MHIFEIPITMPLGFGHEDIDALKIKVLEDFKLEVPTGLQVSLSPFALGKIKYLYLFAEQNKVLSLTSHINDGSTAIPMNGAITFCSNKHIDYGDRLFSTFTTDFVQFKLHTMYERITFSFLYSNGVTEQEFLFSMPMRNVLSL